MSRHLTDHLLVRSVDCELSARRQRVVDAHLAKCQACAARYARARSALEPATLDAMPTYGCPPVEDVASSLHARTRLQATLRAVDARERNVAWAAAGRQPAALALGAAAVLAGLVIGGPAAWSSGPDGDGSKPNARLTPGAVSALTASALCAGERPGRLVTLQAQEQVLRSYRVMDTPAEQFELDALITPELGGTADPANLWPQRYDQPIWNALVKDQLERLLPELVCAGQLELGVAQRAIASDWIAAYKKYLHTDVPLPSDRAEVIEDEELEFEVRLKPDTTIDFRPFRM